MPGKSRQAPAALPDDAGFTVCALFAKPQWNVGCLIQEWQPTTVVAISRVCELAIGLIFIMSYLADCGSLVAVKLSARPLRRDHIGARGSVLAHTDRRTRATRPGAGLRTCIQTIRQAIQEDQPIFRPEATHRSNGPDAISRTGGS